MLGMDQREPINMGWQLGMKEEGCPPSSFLGAGGDRTSRLLLVAWWGRLRLRRASLTIYLSRLDGSVWCKNKMSIPQSCWLPLEPLGTPALKAKYLLQTTAHFLTPNHLRPPTPQSVL